MKNPLIHFKCLFYGIGLLLVLLFCQCEESSDPDPFDGFTDSLTIANYPKVDGSTSAHPLQAIIACKLLEVEYQWVPSWYDETFRVLPSPDEKPETAYFIRDNIVHTGTHGSYVNLINGKADLIIVARAPSEDENELADSSGVELSLEPIALDAFVFIVNIKNPVNALTTNEIRHIYTQEITNWNAVGGTKSPINAYRRNRNSGSQELMETLVMKDLSMPDLPYLLLHSMMGPINSITHDKNGIGYTVYFFEQFMAPNDSLKLLAVNGILPEYNTLKNRDYSYTTEVYAAIRKNINRSSMAYQLYKWLISPQGQEVVEESGYITYY